MSHVPSHSLSFQLWIYKKAVGFLVATEEYIFALFKSKNKTFLRFRGIQFGSDQPVCSDTFV